LAARSLAAVQGFSAMMAELSALVEAGTSAAEVAEAVLKKTGYVESLDAEGEIEAEGRRENLAELIAVAREFEAGTPGGGLAAFLEQVSLVADTDALPDDDDGGVVTLMTLHSAKGLEFPVVFLSGFEDGVFPHIRSLGDAKEMEEERRLAYVGITRAQQRLYVSRSLVRAAWGTPSQNPPSRFLTEIPAELIDWRGHVGPSPAAKLATRMMATGKTAGIGLRPIPVLDIGSRVNHDTFGMGVVVAMRGEGDKSQAQVDFGGEYGEKWLVLRFAPLEKL
jgi:DNA helicase-2/ATP-dependent DNA helicase PcrA